MLLFLLTAAVIGGAVGVGEAMLADVIVEKVQGLITKAKSEKKLEEMKKFFKAKINSKDHKHISLSAYTFDGETQQIEIEGDGVADDVIVGDYIYV